MRIAILVLGILGVLLSILLIAGYFILPEVFNGMSYEEATIMLIAGIPLLLISGLLSLVGIVLVFMNSKSKKN